MTQKRISNKPAKSNLSGDEKIKLAILRQALKEGEESGIADYSLEKIMEELDREKP